MAPVRTPSAFAPLLLVLLAAVLVPHVGWAQDAGVRYRLPDDRVRVDEGAVTLLDGGAEVSYVPGLGWLNGWPHPAPEITADGVLVTEAVADDLALPRLAGIRFGNHGGGVRLVADLRDVEAGALGAGRERGHLEEGAALSWDLPRMLLPAEPLEPYGGIDVRAERRDGGITLRVAGPEAEFHAFTLEDPTRLVLDLTPQAPLAPTAEAREELAPGARYRRFRAPGSDGPGTVHVVEVQPGAGHFRVVGRSGEGRSVSDWADDAAAAINAGYFDPSGFRAIGLRRIDGGVASLPSRNRAAVGFGSQGITIARAAARVRVRVDDAVVLDRHVGRDGALRIVREAGVRAGDARLGVLVVRDGVVTRNVVGPVEVPEGAFALAYDPGLRALAAVDPGARLEVSTRLLPAGLEASRWAVEAGPLLLRDGEVAFDPAMEAFPEDQRILAAVTQQAALGVRADGTVLLVVAERMRAADLVPLMQDLGAVDALRLDSGSSATLVAGGEVRNRLFQRRVSDAIVWRPTVEEAGRAEGP